jgi:hypothetical protein
VALVLDGDGSAARKSDSETLAAVQVAEVQDWAKVRDVPNVAASVISSKSKNAFDGLFIILSTGELPFEDII